MKEFWNTRYSEKEYIYGKEPNEYFKEKIDMIEAGRILLPCDGESRNGVYAATKKWEVTSLDISEKAKEKADELAKSKNVKIQYEVTSIEEFEAEDESFDCITLTFAHFPQKDRENYHRKLIKALN